MKKAVLYARVSSDNQKKDRTIDSQVVALKKQIVDAGDVLVKEYVDDGYSGARLDRPALDQLRKDLKSPLLFESIYFLNADRIARDVIYQNIIISEILKNRKQIIINGKDYVHNPENKFTLTVLGAVAELERAKITERATRGRQMKLAQGVLLGLGCNTYGYDYIHKTPTSPAQLVVNKKEAAVVKSIFTEYAKGHVGMRQITRRLEDMKYPTKKGNKLWRVSLLKTMFRNHTYCGTKYFNKQKKIKVYSDPLNGIKTTSFKLAKRPREDWVGIKVPAIISHALFEKVQERLEWNRKRYRNPKGVQLLTSLVKCGHCGGSVYCYRRYYTKIRKRLPSYVVHRTAYKCNWRSRRLMHSKKSNVMHCPCREIISSALEAKVFNLIERVLLSPEEIKKHMDFFKQKGRAAQLKVERQLKSMDQRLLSMRDERKRIIDIYVSGDLTRDNYVVQSLKFDNEENKLKKDRDDLVRRIPLLHKAEVIDVCIKQYCEAAKARFAQSVDFESKRQFLVDYIHHVVLSNDKIELHGSIPIKTSQIGFCIGG